MTAEAPRFSTSGIGTNDELERELSARGLKFEKTHGSYGGHENSYIIHNPTRETMCELGHKAGQEAIVYGQNGQHELTYTHGPKAGTYHPSLPLVRFSQEKPEDYYTHLPGAGYVSLHFDFDKLHDSPAKHTMSVTHGGPAGEVAQPQLHTTLKSEVLKMLIRALSKASAVEDPHSRKWDGAHPWHEAHSSYHHRSKGHGILLTTQEFSDMLPLAKAEPPLLLESVVATPTLPANEFAKHSAPFGVISPGRISNLRFYQLEGKAPAADQLVTDHGFSTHYIGAKHARHDFHGKNLDHGHLPIHDESGGEEDPTGHGDAWRKTQQLAYALTHPAVNQIYGEGRRNGPLGARSLREAKRTVHWASLAADKQRDLLTQMGVPTSDEDYNRERNTVLADALHRASTGEVRDPAAEGFMPHAHHVPVETALALLGARAAHLGLSSDHAVLKTERDLSAREVALALVSFVDFALKKNRL